MTSSTQAAQALDALVSALVPLVAERLQQSTKPDVYSSSGPLPQGWTRRRFLERVRTMPEAVRAGGKRGRGVEWTISRAAWEAPVSAGAPTGALHNVVSIEALISAGGYRATRST